MSGALLPLPQAGIELNAAEAEQYVAFDGLSKAEPFGRWTDGPEVMLRFRLPFRPEGGVELRLESVGWVARELVHEQRAAISVNGRFLCEWLVMDPVMHTRSLIVPAEWLDDDAAVEIGMRIDTWVRPAELRMGRDTRRLALLFRRLSWAPLVVRRPFDLSGERERHVGRESRKSFAAKIDSGFWRRFIVGPAVLDIGFRGGGEAGVVPIMPGAIGVDTDYPGYDGRTLPFDSDSQDAVYSSHCLEHIPDNIKAIQEWHRVVRVGGHVITVVPSAHLYERKRRVPSYWNFDHRRTYTPASLLAEFEAALQPNSYRVRHLAENDAHYQYGLPINAHPEGCHEIELVIEKIAPPGWGFGE